VLLRLLVQLSLLMLPVQLPLMVQFVLGIVHKIDAETKIAKILVEQLMQHVKPKELDVLLVQMENVPKFKIVNKLQLEVLVLKEQMDHVCGLMISLTLMDLKELASDIHHARVYLGILMHNVNGLVNNAQQMDLVVSELLNVQKPIQMVDVSQDMMAPASNQFQL